MLMSLLLKFCNTQCRPFISTMASVSTEEYEGCRWTGERRILYNAEF